ncbi:uncharacterized protein LOC131226899 [Magnolia sinica]|uniref:uncharacterized protein LOC131226899 n=1 Tax=Magnolia sinica TaxID=86752 RepID=UPI002658A9F8|nr:uncharacterized protein LOC131226899 [Magnolia sinica]
MWTEECELAFQELKHYMGSPPLLSKPERGKPLLLYLAVSSAAAEELLALWTYRTTAQTTIGETPFSLAFGAKAVVPIEVGLPFAQTQSYDKDKKAELMMLDLDLLEKKREQARLRAAAQQRQVERFYNSKVKTRRF